MNPEDQSFFDLDDAGMDSKEQSPLPLPGNNEAAPPATGSVGLILTSVNLVENSVDEGVGASHAATGDTMGSTPHDSSSPHSPTSPAAIDFGYLVRHCKVDNFDDEGMGLLLKYRCRVKDDYEMLRLLQYRATIILKLQANLPSGSTTLGLCFLTEPHLRLMEDLLKQKPRMYDPQSVIPNSDVFIETLRSMVEIFNTIRELQEQASKVHKESMEGERMLRLHPLVGYSNLSQTEQKSELTTLITDVIDDEKSAALDEENNENSLFHVMGGHITADPDIDLESDPSALGANNNNNDGGMPITTSASTIFHGQGGVGIHAVLSSLVQRCRQAGEFLLAPHRWEQGWRDGWQEWAGNDHFGFTEEDIEALFLLSSPDPSEKLVRTSYTVHTKKIIEKIVVGLRDRNHINVDTATALRSPNTFCRAVYRLMMDVCGVSQLEQYFLEKNRDVLMTIHELFSQTKIPSFYDGDDTKSSNPLHLSAWIKMFHQWAVDNNIEGNGSEKGTSDWSRLVRIALKDKTPDEMLNLLARHQGSEIAREVYMDSKSDLSDFIKLSEDVGKVAENVFPATKDPVAARARVAGAFAFVERNRERGATGMLNLLVDQISVALARLHYFVKQAAPKEHWHLDAAEDLRLDNCSKTVRCVLHKTKQDDGIERVYEVGLRCDGYYRLRGSTILWSSDNPREEGQELEMFLDANRDKYMRFSQRIGVEFLVFRVHLQPDRHFEQMNSTASIYRTKEQRYVDSSNERVPFLRMGIVLVQASVVLQRFKKILDSPPVKESAAVLLEALEFEQLVEAEIASGRRKRQFGYHNIPISVQHQLSPLLQTCLKHITTIYKSHVDNVFSRSALTDMKATLKSMLLGDNNSGAAEIPHALVLTADELDLCETYFFSKGNISVPLERIYIDEQSFVTNLDRLVRLANGQCLTIAIVTFVGEVDAPLLIELISKTRSQSNVLRLLIPAIAGMTWLVTGMQRASSTSVFATSAVRQICQTRVVAPFGDDNVLFRIMDQNAKQVLESMQHEDFFNLKEVTSAAFEVQFGATASSSRQGWAEVVKRACLVDAAAALPVDASTKTRAKLLVIVAGSELSAVEGELRRILPKEDDGNKHVTGFISGRSTSSDFFRAVRDIQSKANSVNPQGFTVVVTSANCLGVSQSCQMVETFAAMAQFPVSSMIFTVTDVDPRYCAQEGANIDVEVLYTLASVDDPPATESKSYVWPSALHEALRNLNPLANRPIEANVVPFRFFLQNVPLCEFLTHRDSVRLYLKTFFPEAGVEAKSFANISGLTLADSAARLADRDGSDESWYETVFSPAPTTSATIFSCVASGQLELDWNAVAPAWAQACTLNATDLFAMMDTYSFPLRMLFLLDPQLLKEQLSVIGEGCARPLVRRMRERLKDPLLQRLQSISTPDAETLRRLLSTIAWLMLRKGLLAASDAIHLFTCGDVERLSSAGIVIELPNRVTHGDIFSTVMSTLASMDETRDSVGVLQHQQQVQTFVYDDAEWVHLGQSQSSSIGSAMLRVIVANVSLTPKSSLLKDSSACLVLRTWYREQRSSRVALLESTTMKQHLAHAQTTISERFSVGARALLLSLCDSYSAVEFLYEEFLKHLSVNEKKDVVMKCIAVYLDESSTSGFTFTAVVVWIGRLFRDKCADLTFASNRAFQSLVLILSNASEPPTIEKLKEIRVLPVQADETIFERVRSCFNSNKFQTLDLGKVICTYTPFLESHFSEVDRLWMLQSVALETDAALTSCLFVLHPLTAIPIVESPVSKKAFTAIRKFANSGSSLGKKFSSVIKQNQSSAPPFAAMLAGVEECIDAASLDMFRPMMGLERVPVQRVLLMDQCPCYVSYILSHSKRPITDSALKKIFHDGELITPKLLPADLPADRWGMHLAVARGVSRASIQANIEIITSSIPSTCLSVPIGQTPSEKQNWRNDVPTTHVIYKALAVLWFLNLDLGLECVASLIRTDDMKQLLRKSWIAITQDYGEVLTKGGVYGPMPSFMHLHLIPPQPVEVPFGTSPKDIAFTLLILSQAVEAFPRRNPQGLAQLIKGGIFSVDQYEMCDSLPLATHISSCKDLDGAAGRIAGLRLVQYCEATTSDALQRFVNDALQRFVNVVMQLWSTPGERCVSHAALLLQQMVLTLCRGLKASAPPVLSTLLDSLVLAISLSQPWSVSLINALLKAVKDAQCELSVGTRAELTYAFDNWGLKLDPALFARPEKQGGMKVGAHDKVLSLRALNVTDVRNEDLSPIIQFVDDADQLVMADSTSATQSGQTANSGAAGAAAAPIVAFAFNDAKDAADGVGCGDDADDEPEEAVVMKVSKSASLADKKESFTIDVSAVVEIVFTTSGPFQQNFYGEVQLKRGWECYLVQLSDCCVIVPRDNLDLFIKDNTEGNPSISVLHRFIDYHSAWTFCTDRPRNVTLVGNGFFFVKAKNNDMLMYITCSSDANAQEHAATVWNILHLHRLLSYRISDEAQQVLLQFCLLNVEDADARAELRSEPTNCLENVVEYLIDRDTQSDRTREDVTKDQQRYTDLEKLFKATFYGESIVAPPAPLALNLMLKSLLEMDDKSRINIIDPCIKATTEEDFELMRAGLIKALQSCIGLGVRRELRTLFSVMNHGKSVSKPFEHPGILNVVFSSLPLPANSTAVASQDTHADPLTMTKTMDTWIGEESNVEHEFREKYGPAAAAGAAAAPAPGSSEEIKAMFRKKLGEPASQQSQVGPAILEREFGFGGLPYGRFVNFSVRAASEPPLITWQMYEVPKTIQGSHVVGMLYDSRIVNAVIVIWKRESQVEKTVRAELGPSATQPQINEEVIKRTVAFKSAFENWLCHVISSPIDRSGKIWLVRHVCFDSIEEPTEACKALVATPVVSYCLATTLPELSEKKGILQRAILKSLKISAIDAFQSNCQRGNDTYGMHLRSSAAFYNDSMLLSAEYTAPPTQVPHAELYLGIISKFSEFVTHVRVRGLRTIHDLPLKWLAEYTFAFPWRFVQLYDCDTSSNLPENRDRLHRAFVYSPLKVPLPQYCEQTYHLPASSFPEIDVSINSTKEFTWKDDVADFAKESQPDTAEGGAVLLVSPPGAGKSYLADSFKQLLGGHIFFRLDCSSDRLVTESMQKLLDRKCPADGKVLLVADEFHFLDKKKKREMRDWMLEPGRMARLVVLMIANREEDCDADMIDKLKSSKIRALHVRAALSASDLLECSKTILRRASNEPIATRFLLGFHCARRGLFSDDANTLRDRELIITCACPSPDSAKMESLALRFADKINSVGPFSYEFVYLYHKLFFETLPTGGVGDLTEDEAQLATLLEQFTTTTDPRRMLVIASMLPYLTYPTELSEAGGAASLVELCYDEKGLQEENNATECFGSKLHPLKRLVVWMEYIFMKCGVPEKFNRKRCLEVVMTLSVYDVMGFPLVEAGGTASSAVKLTKCMAVKHNGPFNDLKWLRWCCINNKGIDWKNDVEHAWKRMFVVSIPMLTALLSSATDRQVVVQALTPANLVMLVNSCAYNSTLAAHVLSSYPTPRLTGELHAFVSPVMTILWRMLRNRPLAEWRKDPSLQTWAKADALASAFVSEEKQKDPAFKREIRTLISAMLLLRWVGVYAAFQLDVIGDAVERRDCFQATVKTVIAAWVRSEPHLTPFLSPTEQDNLLRVVINSSLQPFVELVPGFELRLAALLPVFQSVWPVPMQLSWKILNHWLTPDEAATAFKIGLLREDSDPRVIVSVLLTQPTGELHSAIQLHVLQLPCIIDSTKVGVALQQKGDIGDMIKANLDRGLRHPKMSDVDKIALKGSLADEHVRPHWTYLHPT